MNCIVPRRSMVRCSVLQELHVWLLMEIEILSRHVKGFVSFENLMVRLSVTQVQVSPLFLVRKPSRSILRYPKGPCKGF